MTGQVIALVRQELARKGQREGQNIVVRSDKFEMSIRISTWSSEEVGIEMSICKAKGR